MSTGWYAVTGDNITINRRLVVNGVVNLILCDGKKLNVELGTTVNAGNTLNIYCQQNETGELKSKGATTYGAGIGGGYIEKDGPASSTVGPINIYGGDITATGGIRAAGIGGGSLAKENGTLTMSPITIYGGKIVAENGTSGTTSSSGAGIGGGGFFHRNVTYNVGQITINGGDVTATGGSFYYHSAYYGDENCGGAGIGTGGLTGWSQDYYGKATLAGVTINGGKVTATGGTNSAGIGIGYKPYHSASGASAGDIIINGGEVTATGGSATSAGMGFNTTDATLRSNLVLNNGIQVAGGSSADPTEIKSNYNEERWQYMVAKVHHIHDWSYTAEGDTITAECSTPDCPVTTGLDLTLNAPSDLAYDGTAKEAFFTAGYSTAAFPDATIKYFKGGEAVDECVTAGDYTAEVTFGEATVSVDFSIVKHTHDDIEFTAWDSDNSLPSDAGSYYLTKDVAMTTTWNVDDGKTINLCLNGHSIISSATNQGALRVSTGGVLNLYDCDTTEHYYYVDEGGVTTITDDNTDADYIAATKKGSFKGGYISASSTYVLHVRVSANDTSGDQVSLNNINVIASGSMCVYVANASTGYAYYPYVELNGCSIVGNAANNSYGLYVGGATNVAIKDTVITNNTRGVRLDGMAEHPATLIVKENVQIYDNTNYDFYFYSKYGKVVYESEIDSDHQMYVSARTAALPITFTSALADPGHGDNRIFIPKEDTNLIALNEEGEAFVFAPGETTYNFDSFVWAEDNKSALVKLVNSGDPTDIIYISAEMDIDVKVEPTCISKGSARYTATYDTHSEYKDVELSTIPHDYVFTTNEATITATCSRVYCGDSVSITLQKKDGEDSEAELVNSEAWVEHGLEVPTIYYEGTGETTYEKSETAPTAIGTYKASITCGDKTVSIDVSSYAPLNPVEEIKIEIPDEKPQAEAGDVIKVDTNAKPVNVKWYYDDDNDGLPDDPSHPIGEGVEYTVVCPDPDDPSHDDTGHVIIAEVVQNKDVHGDPLPAGDEIVVYTDPINVGAPLTPEDVEDLIDAIPEEITYTEECKKKIDDARKGYDGLDEDQKEQVSQQKYKTLTDAEAAYKNLDDQHKANEVKDKIDDIPVAIEYNQETKDKIDAAREAYDELSDDQKELVGQEEYKKLTDAEAAYEVLKENHEAADGVKDKIDAIPGTIEYDEDTKDKIDAAREAYDGLTDAQKELVGQEEYKKLTDAEAAYKVLDDEHKANEVKDKIDDIPVTIEYNQETKDKIDAARGGYDALTPDQKELVGEQEYKKLTDAEAAYKVLDDQHKANEVKDKIDDIPVAIEYNQETKDKIDAAREAYDELSDDQKELVGEQEYKKLTDAEDAYEVLKENHEAADGVKDKIDAIPGTIEYDEDTKDKIDAAREAYDGLTDAQKELVGQEEYKKLTDAEAAYKNLDDQHKANEVKDKIDAIPGTIEYNQETKDKIDAARGGYDALTPDQKGLVGQEEYKKLTDAEAAYKVVKDIHDIGTLEYTEAKKGQIEKARNSYNALSEGQKDLIGQSDVNLLEKKEADFNAVKDAVNKANGIGEVTHDSASKGRIESAKEANNSLTSDQRAFFPQESAKKIADSATVYDALDKIYAIQQVGYDTESEAKINEARELYDSLTEEQKAMVNAEDLKVLTNSETQYGSMKNGAFAIVIIFLILVILLLLCGVFFLLLIILKKRKDDEKKEGPTKVASFGGAIALIVLASHYADPSYIALYVLIGVTVLIWGTSLFIYFNLKYHFVRKIRNKFSKNGPKEESKDEESFRLFDKPFGETIRELFKKSEKEPVAEQPSEPLVAEEAKEKEKAEEPVPAEEPAPKPEEQKAEEPKPVEETSASEDEEEVVTVTDEKGNIFQIRFVKSFTAKLIQSPDETKKYYEELKNEVLSYKKTNSRVSWNYDSINSGRNQVLKFAVRGKTLCVYFPLNADDYAETKYKVEKVESKKFEDVPCLYRIKNDRRLGYAKDLIAVVCEKLGLVKGEEQHESYANLPYEPNKPLIERGLIKELKVQVNKPVEEPVAVPAEPEIVETKVNADGDEVVMEKDAQGNLFEIRYVKSFTAKLSQAEDVTKDYYSILKNYVLSYKGVHARLSWHYDAVNIGREYVLKFAIRGKTLCVFFALDASTLEEKYKVEEAKGKKYEDVPVLYRIKNDRRCEYAKQLIDQAMAKFGLAKVEEPNEDYRIPYETTKELLAKGLIKEVKTKVQNNVSEPIPASISVEQADQMMSDEKAEASVEEDTVHQRREGKKEIINIDTLSQNYNNGDEVTLDSLIEKGLVPPKTGHVKVLARGILDKRLIVDLDDYSLQAVKMIVLMGGHAKKIK